MPGAKFFALFDDIALLLDDVAAMSKVAAKKTAGVLGDDLAVNAEQVSGVKADRELPVVWAVAKGSFINKLFLVPAALLISFFTPWLIVPLLILGGLFLCFEGAEKIIELVANTSNVEQHKSELVQANVDPEVNLVEFEQSKIKGAIRTDFVLSAEIIIIALGTVANVELSQQIAVLSVIAIGMTIGVYGLVAVIVKLDDLGLYWQQLPPANLGRTLLNKIGAGLLAFAPRLMQSLSWIGLNCHVFSRWGDAHPQSCVASSLICLVRVSTANINEGILHALMTTLLDGTYGVIAGFGCRRVIAFITHQQKSII